MCNGFSNIKLDSANLMNDKKFKGISINNDLLIDVVRIFSQYILTNHMNF